MEIWKPLNCNTISDNLGQSQSSITRAISQNVKAHAAAYSQAVVLISSQIQGDLPEPVGFHTERRLDGTIMNQNKWHICCKLNLLNMYLQR